MYFTCRLCTQFSNHEFGYSKTQFHTKILSCFNEGVNKILFIDKTLFRCNDIVHTRFFAITRSASALRWEGDGFNAWS